MWITQDEGAKFWLSVFTERTFSLPVWGELTSLSGSMEFRPEIIEFCCHLYLPTNHLTRTHVAQILREAVRPPFFH